MLRKFQQTEENLFGASMPETIQDIKELKRLGISAIVSLEKMPEIIELEAKRQGMQIFHLPLDDAMPPTIPEVKQFLKFVNSNLSQGKKVFVHCYKGTGRTREMLAFYLIYRGASPFWAHSKVGGVETPEQKKFLIEYGIKMQKAVQRLKQIQEKRRLKNFVQNQKPKRKHLK